MNKKTIERGFKYAKKTHEKTGKVPDMSDEKYDLCSADFRLGVEMFKNELKTENNLKE